MPFHTDENGEFQIAVIPGRGILGAWAAGPYRYGSRARKHQGAGPRGLDDRSLRSPTRSCRCELQHPRRDRSRRPGEESVTVDIGLDRGRTLKGKLVGPDGEPVAGALMMGAEDCCESMVRATASHGRVRGARARDPSGSAGCSSITRRSSSPGPTWSSPMRRAP